jgi:hypothetical protein
MGATKRILLIFVVDTLTMLISWAGLSLLLFGVRGFLTPQSLLAKLLSLYSLFVIMFCYALYLVFDLCCFFSTEIRMQK